jgi:hypothetical protein
MLDNPDISSICADEMSAAAVILDKDAQNLASFFDGEKRNVPVQLWRMIDFLFKFGMEVV